MRDFGKLMKQAKEMQTRMAKIQEELAAKRVEGTSGGGMVKITMNGQQEILAVSIEPDVFTEGDREMLEDLIVAAAGDARKKALELTKESMADLTGGFSIPGLF